MSPIEGTPQPSTRQAQRLGSACFVVLLISTAGLLLWQNSSFLFSSATFFHNTAWAKTAARRWPPHATCPVEYQPIPYEDIKSGTHRPYLFGQPRLPNCTNCQDDSSWGRFCRYDSSGPGPVCDPEDIPRVIDYFVGRAEAGAPGVREMLILTPCDLWPYLRNRTLWLVGDSITQEHMRASQCFFKELWDMQPKAMTDDSEAEAAIRADTGVTPWCINLAENSRICHIRSNMGPSLSRDVLPNAHRVAKRKDIWVENFAVWVNNEGEYKDHLEIFAEAYLKYKHELPFFIWRDASVQHFDTPSGTFREEYTRCRPINVTLEPDNSLSTTQPELEIVVAGDWRNQIATPVMQRLGIPVMHTWNWTIPLWEYHHNYNRRGAADCTHVCHPTVYEMWIWHLYHTLQGAAEALRQHMAEAEPEDHRPPIRSERPEGWPLEELLVVTK